MYDIVDNEGGGTTVRLTKGDSLDDVPGAYQRLITEPIRKAFEDPLGYFSSLAAEAPVPAMKRWLQAVLCGKDWELHLHQGSPEERTSAGYCWWSDSVRSAEVAPPDQVRGKMLLPILDSYFSIVDHVQWLPFGCAGGLSGCGEHTPLTTFPCEYHGAEIDPEKTFVLGWSPGGNMLIYTTDDRGGWVCHENGKVHLLGSVADTLEWVYSQLLADECPDFDYIWAW